MSYSIKSKTTWSELSTVVEKNGSFLVTSHVSPDGDCIGSQLAFQWYLASRGKHADIYNMDPVPYKFAYLPGVDLISTKRAARGYDVLVVLDSSNPNRLGWKPDLSEFKTIINIDHHEDNTSFAHYNVVREHAAATAQLIYDFFAQQRIDFPPQVAQALYTAIMTDTGGFRFSNTDGEVLRICADLVDRGVSASEVYREVYVSQTPQGQLLQSRMWSTLSFHLDGRVCTMDLPLSLIDELKAAYGDSEGMADHTVSAQGVEVGMVLKHTAEECHFSLRSSGNVDVGKIARMIRGGGGHSSAAGCTIQLPRDKALPQMLGILEKELG